MLVCLSKRWLNITEGFHPLTLYWRLLTSATTSSLAHIGELFSVMQSLGELFNDCSPDLNPHSSGREDSHLITNDPSGHPPHYELIPMHTTTLNVRLVHLSILTPLSLIWRGLRVPDVSGVFYHYCTPFLRLFNHGQT